MISVTILTKNCQDTLQETLKSLEGFSEVLIFDTGSTDQTLDIAKSFSNVRVEEGAFIGFGPTHNEASSRAKYEWILSIDSDEVLSPALSQEIRSLKLDNKVVYTLLRKNFYNGKHITCCAGWHPDWVRRLYNKTVTAFNDAPVHEKILKNDLEEIKLISPLYHTPYRKINDFLAKMQIYSTLFAEKKLRRSSSNILIALFHSWFAFFKSYILKRGFLGGREGFIISIYNSHTTFYKYLKLEEYQKKQI